MRGATACSTVWIIERFFHSLALCATSSPCQHHTITALCMPKHLSHGALNVRCDTMHLHLAGGLENRQISDTVQQYLCDPGIFPSSAD